MQYKAAAIVLAGLAVQQVTGFGGSWNDQSPYSCPENTNNQCSSSQQGGYDWSGLQSGSFSSYGDNQFSGFSCSDSFNKRDVLTKRQFQSKCITGNLDDSPSMSCGDDSSFSIDQIQVSSSQDADIECHYGMPDGTTCTEYHSCSSEGSVFQNSQCGGAKSVTFKPGKNAPPSCSIGVHSIGFNCGSASSTAAYTQPTSYSSSAAVQSYPSTTPSSAVASSTPGCYGSSCSSSVAAVGSSAPPCYGSSCPSPTAAAGSSAPPCYGASCSSSAAAVSSSAPPCYGASCSSSSAPAVGSSAPPCYGAGCSSSSVAAVGSSAPPCYGASCSSSSAVIASASSSAPAVSSYPVQSSSSAAATSPAPPSCPDLLPRCIKTWLFLTSCKDASDYKCFCGEEKFITNVFSCLSAWGSESDVQKAASYLMGICAASVPTNPAIVTACPSTVTPTVSATETGKCTTVTYSSPAVVPATYTTGVSAGYTIASSYYTTSLVTIVTVPQVQFTTSTITVSGKTTCSVGLGAGTPSSAAAYTTPPSATTTGLICDEYKDGQPQCSSAAAGATGTTFGTSWGSSPSASSSPIVPATGGSVKVGSGLAGLALGALAALAVF